MTQTHKEKIFYCYDCAKETEEDDLDFHDYVGEPCCPKCGSTDIVEQEEE